MAIIINSIQHLLLKPQSPLFAFPPHHRKQKPKSQNLAFYSKPHRWRPLKSCMTSQEIDMVRTKDGVYAAKAKKVVILWDLDNKPLRGPPYEAALALKSVAQKFGDMIDMSAYANRHAFVHLSQWVVEERRERRHLEILERKGLSASFVLYSCSVCRRKFKAQLEMKKHFWQLDERERQKNPSHFELIHI